MQNKKLVDDETGARSIWFIDEGEALKRLLTFSSCNDC